VIIADGDALEENTPIFFRLEAISPEEKNPPRGGLSSWRNFLRKFLLKKKTRLAAGFFITT